MKKNYLIPSLEIIVISEAGMIADSIKVGNTNEKVNNSTDIGFVKGNNTPNNHNVWDDDWSK